MASLSANPTTILKVLPYFKEKSFSVDNASEETGVPYQTIQEIVKPLIEQRYTLEQNGNLVNNEGAIIFLSVQALKNGASLDEVFKIVRWQDFENFIEMILYEHGYTTYKNYRMKKPRIEVDILALKRSFGLLVDCKQWHKILGPSNLNSIVKKQIERAKIMLLNDKKMPKDIFLVPVVVTLFPSSQRYYEGVPIVACDMLKSFINEVDGRMDEVLKVSIKDGKVSSKI